MIGSPSRRGFSKFARVPRNKNKEKMSAPNNATYVLIDLHAGLPNSVTFTATFDTAFALKEIDDLANVNISSPSNNHLLVFNSSSGKWENTQALVLFSLVVNGTTTLDSNINGILKASSGVVSGSAALNDLDDVSGLTSLVKGDMLIYDGDGWIHFDRPIAAALQYFRNDSSGNFAWVTIGDKSISAYHSANQAASTGTYADVLFDTEHVKTGITHSTSSNTYEFEIDKTNIYDIEFNGSFVWSSGGSSVIICKLQIDTGEGYGDIAGAFARDQATGATGGSGSLNVRILQTLNDGDKIKAQFKDIGGVSILQAEQTRMVIRSISDGS